MAHRFMDYAKRARSRFCAGSRKAPIELVLSGKRSLEEWVEVLDQERRRSQHRVVKHSSQARAGELVGSAFQMNENAHAKTDLHRAASTIQ